MSSESSDDESDGFSNCTDNFRGFKKEKKRKAGKTPIKEDHVKKANTAKT